MRPPRRGAVALEYALVFPTLLLVLLAILEFSWVFYQHGVATRAVRWGCRQGALSEADPAGVASSSMEAYLQEHRYACPPGRSCEPQARVDGEVLVCSAALPVRSLSTLVPGVGDLTLRAGTRMHVE